MWNAIIDDFVTKTKQDRMRMFAASPRREHQLYYELLHHSGHFAKRCIVQLPTDVTRAKLMSMLGTFGLQAKQRCWVYGHCDLDEQWSELETAVEQIFMRSCESIVYAPKQGVAYFEGGHSFDRMILKR